MRDSIPDFGLPFTGETKPTGVGFTSLEWTQHHSTHKSKLFYGLRQVSVGLKPTTAAQ
jgi:hypothetical protein